MNLTRRGLIAGALGALGLRKAAPAEEPVQRLWGPELWASLRKPIGNHADMLIFDDVVTEDPWVNPALPYQSVETEMARRAYCEHQRRLYQLINEHDFGSVFSSDSGDSEPGRR